jgi:hypothetical protein
MNNITLQNALKENDVDYKYITIQFPSMPAHMITQFCSKTTGKVLCCDIPHDMARQGTGLDIQCGEYQSTLLWPDHTLELYQINMTDTKYIRKICDVGDKFDNVWPQLFPPGAETPVEALEVLRTKISKRNMSELRRKANFDYWLRNGHHRGKGELQIFIDELPEITNAVRNGRDLTITDEEIIYDAMGAREDLEILAEKWPDWISSMKQHLPSGEVTKAERDKAAVEALSGELVKLLLDLQNAYDDKSLNWAQVKESIKTKVHESRRRRDDKIRRRIKKGDVGGARDSGKLPGKTRKARMDEMLCELREC